MSRKYKRNPLETMNSSPATNTVVSLPTLDYDIVEDIKKTHANISLYELTKIMS